MPTVLLPDIPRGPTWTRDHMHQCLLRWIARQPKEIRRAFYRSWEKRYGTAATKQLAAEAAQTYRSGIAPA